MHATKKQLQKGFTLIEVLLVVAIIAILAGIVIIAVNPTKNLADSRNTQRSADVNTIVNSVYQYAIDNNATPSTITTTSTEICATAAASCTGLIDLSAVTTGGKYVVKIPIDPVAANVATNGTGYKISKDANGRITVSAPGAELSKTISVTR